MAGLTEGPEAWWTCTVCKVRVIPQGVLATTEAVLRLREHVQECPSAKFVTTRKK